MWSAASQRSWWSCVIRTWTLPWSKRWRSARRGRRPSASASRRHGAARSSCPARSTVPISTRWPRSPAATETTWSPCSVRPGSPSRSWGSRQGSPTSTGSPTAWRPSRGGPGRRPAVPAGSVALANGHAAVYPTASPGGWHLVGRTAFPFFTPTAPPYAALTFGDVVRFTVAGPGQPVEPEPRGAARLAGGRRGPHRCSRSWRPGCAPCSRTTGAAAWPPSAFPTAVRPTRTPSCWRTGWWATATERARWRSPPAAPGCAASSACHVAVVGGAPDVRVDGAAVPAGQVVPLAPGPAARDRAPARRAAHVSGRGRRPARTRAVRQPGQRRAERLGPGPARAGPGPLRRTLGTAAR